MFSPQYEAQTELLIHCIPEVSKHPCFALKGGTAINLFLRNMPRVSVDIDLTYLPLKPRDESLREIEQTLLRMKLDIERNVTGTHVNERQFLLSMKSGEPDWAVLGIEGLERMPALQWKLLNIRKMDTRKRDEQLGMLKNLLGM